MTFPAIDSTAVRWSVPRESVASALAERPLLIMMHGYGSNEGDLYSLGQYMPEQFVIASLRAPLQAGPGNAWFAIDYDAENDTLRRDINEVTASTHSLIAWIDELEAEVGGLPQTALLGFSQGGVMLTQLFRHQPERYAAGVFFASFAVDDTTEGGAQRDAALAEVTPPLFWGRDPQDPVITPNLIDFTRRWLPEHFDVEAKLYAHVGHSLSLEEIEDSVAFLRQHVTG
jgi:phospholipase/carboxylesterase